MKYLSTEEIRLADIDVSDRLRAVDDDWAAGLAESFDMIGQKEPVEVVELFERGKYRLIAGGHRYAAAVLCGWETIRAEVKQAVTANADLEIRLHEIDENLIRRELNALDRAVFLGERQKIYEQMYPETANGKTPGNQHTGQKRETDIVSFSQSTAEKLDISERTVRRATTIYRGISAELRARIAGTPLANKQGELYKLTRYSPERQAEIVGVCARTEAPAESVSAAVQELDGAHAEPRDPEQAAFDALTNRWRSTPAGAKGRFLDWLTETGVIDRYDGDQLA